jgi:hypothetical protein
LRPGGGHSTREGRLWTNTEHDLVTEGGLRHAGEALRAARDARPSRGGGPPSKTSERLLMKEGHWSKTSGRLTRGGGHLSKTSERLTREGGRRIATDGHWQR